MTEDKLTYILIPDDIMDKFNFKEDMTPREIRLYLLRKMYYSFNQVAQDCPDSPLNIWFEKNRVDTTYRIDKNGHLVSNAPSVPDDVREAQERYRDDINAGIELYAKFFKNVSNEAACTYAAYLQSLNPKVRWTQLKKLNPDLIRIGAFDDDQAWYVYEGLVNFKNSKRMGHPGDVTEEDWEKYLDDMIFAFHEVVFQNEKLDEYEHNVEEYWQKYNNGKKLFGEYFLDLWD